jgi:PAS domain S-box-containing protein
MPFVGLRRTLTVTRDLFRGAAISEPDVARAYDEDGRRACRRGIRRLCQIALWLVTARFLISFIVESNLPDLVAVTLIRAGVAIALSVVMMLLDTLRGVGRTREIGVAAVVGIAVAMEALAAQSPATAAEQRQGLNFLILGAGVLISWSPLWMAGVSAAVIAVPTGWALLGPTGWGAAFLPSDFGFLLLSSLFAVLFSGSGEGARWREFAGRRELLEARRERATQERHYHSLVATAGSAIVVLGPDLRIREFNAAAERIFGRSGAQVMGESYVELFVPPIAWEEARAFVRRVLAGEATFATEGAVSMPDGRVRYVLWENTCLRDDNGVPIALLGVGQDVTDRHAAERARRESETRLRRLVEGTNAIPWEANPETWRLTYVGPKAGPLLGFRPEEWCAPGFWDAQVHPEDRERVLAVRRAVLATGREHDIEYRLRTATGGFVSVQDLIAIERDGLRPVQLHGFMIEVTERKVGEQALRNSEAQLRSLVESTNAVIFEASAATGRFTYLSPQVEDLLGYPAVAWHDPAFVADHVHPEDRGIALEFIGRLTPGVETVELEFRMRAADGRWVSIHDYLALDWDGGAVRTIRGVAIDVTARRHAEAAAHTAQEALRRSEERYRAIVEDQTELICRFDPHGLILFVNEAYCRYFDRRREDLLGTTWQSEIDPEDLPRVRGFFASLGPERPTGDIELRVRCADGALRWQHWTNRVMLDADRKIVEFQSVGRDVTDRREAVEHAQRLNAELEARVLARTSELAASERRLRSIFEAAPGGMVVANGAGQIVQVNPASVAMLGYAAHELVGKTVADITHPDDIDRSAEAIRAVGEGGDPIRLLEKRYLRRDGSIVWAATTVVALSDDPQGRGQFLATIEDITSRRHRQAIAQGERLALEVLAREDLLERALGVLVTTVERYEPDMVCAVWVTSVGGELVLAAARHLPGECAGALGVLRPGPGGGPVERAADARDWVIVDDLAHDPSPPSVAPLLGAHDFRAWWARPVVAAVGDVVGVVAVFYRTARAPSPAEGRLLDEMARVAAVVIERKHAAGLLRKREAERAHAGRVGLLGELTASLAHQMHQPLAAIVNYAGACERLLANERLEREKLVYLTGQIRTVALRGGDVIRGIRTFARKGDGKRGWVDVNALVRNAVTLTEAEARHRGVTVGLELDAQLPEIHADGVQIEQVILNLVTNGVEAMGVPAASGADLVIRTQPEGDDAISVAVRDRGIGFPGGGSARMFEPFVTSKPDGLGMGLAICRSIVEAHHGRLWVRPNEDGGAIVGFTVPIDAS